ncbi:unnamed protein product, partial [Phaeothamnion confervicola]
EAQRRLEALLRGGHFSRHRHTNSRSIDITAGRDRVVLKLCNDATAVEWSVLPPHPAAAAVALPSVAGPKRGNVDLAAVAAVVPTGEAGLVILGDSGTKLLEVDAESVEVRASVFLLFRFCCLRSVFLHSVSPWGFSCTVPVSFRSPLLVDLLFFLRLSM